MYKRVDLTLGRLWLLNDPWYVYNNNYAFLLGGGDLAEPGITFFQWCRFSPIRAQIGRELVRLITLINLNKFLINTISPKPLKTFSRTKEVVHSGYQLPYLLADFVHYITLKTLQPGHWEVIEFFYAKLGTFRDLQRAP